MEPWRKVWREGIAPLLSDEGLEALRIALLTKDPRLIQGATTRPPPLFCGQDWPVEAACALSYTGWKGNDLNTVGEVEEYFARMCYEIDQNIGEPGGCRHFLNWFDETDRNSMLIALLPEVVRTITERENKLNRI